MEKLPNCVLSDIFVRLKAKQLAQMRSVSKSWNSHLSHPLFIKHHLDHSSVHHNNDGILLVFRLFFSFCVEEPFELRSSRSPNLELPNFIKLPANPQSKSRRGYVIGSVNGLICFEYKAYNESEAIHIWNPSLSALLTLPTFSMPSDDYGSSWNYLRFGFDPTNNDYKVVKVTGIVAPNSNNIAKWLQVEVYSMRRGTWELITHNIPSHLKNTYIRDMACADGHNGHLHWLAHSTLKIAKQRILAFDLGAETFREIPLPDAVLDETLSGMGNDLGVFTGKLCVMLNFQASESTKFELWVMDEYGVAESWVKLLDISPCEFSPRGFISHHEFLFQDLEGDIALYDSVAATTKFFMFCCGNERLHRVIRYVDSLVWVSPASASCCSISEFPF